MTSRLKTILTGVFALALACNFIAGGAHARQNQPFKNLQVLKGLSPDQLLLLMGGYSVALGRNCDFCHEMAALEKGEKPEHKKALQMIKMTRDINAAIKDTYRMSVDCMSCHQGKAIPTPGSLPLPMPGPGPTPEPEPKPGPEPKPAAEPPTNVTYATSFSGATKVLFPHDKHMILSSDCTKCHHNGENNKCDTCHLHKMKTSPVTQVSFYVAVHGSKSERACIGCHTQSKAGPATCIGCHRK